jgi:peptide/nickel transport system permease protein
MSCNRDVNAISARQQSALIGIVDGRSLPLVQLRGWQARKEGPPISTYLLRRAGASLVILLGLSVLIFAMLHIIGGSPGKIILGPLKASQAQINAWNASHGFDDPFFVQYGRYMWQLLHGNLGQSYTLNESVDTVLAQHAPISAYLSGLALAFSVLVAVPMGIGQAVRRNSAGDHALTVLSFITYSTPPFLLGLLLIWTFAIDLHLFPVGEPAAVSKSSSLTTLVLISVAAYSRYMRSSALDTLSEDYIKAARARGLPERLVLWRHLVRNACLPMVTLVGLSIPDLLAGNLITENVFNYPGLGVMFIDALQREDYPVLLGYTLMGGVLTIVGNYVADIALTVADPRIRIA